MKRNAKRVLIVMMCCILLIPCFAGCSQKGKTFMKLDGEKMSVNTYMLFLSRVKGTLCSSANFGASALKDSFWDTVMDSDGVTTYNDYYSNMVLESAKSYLAASYLFDKENLTLDKSVQTEIDEIMSKLVTGEGSKTALNSKLAEFGVNYAVLKDAYEIEAKISALSEHFYGADGSKISSNVIEEYYQQNYVKFKHVFLYTYAIVYETDDNGDEIYYTSDGRIAYDTSRRQKLDAAGEPVKDSNGDIIYVKRDGSGRIAYDTDNGERKPAIDDNGYTMTREYTTEELREVSDMAQIIMESTVEGDEKIFDSLVEAYNEDVGMDEYTGGFYLTKDTAYDSPEVKEALFEMKEGEIRKIRSDYGIHIVMKYKLDEGGYAKSSNSVFFADENGKYLFMDDLKAKLLEARLESYVSQIEVNEDLIKGVDMKSVGVNYNY